MKTHISEIKLSLTQISAGLLCGYNPNFQLDYYVDVNTGLKDTQKVEISEETDFLRISQKPHFPKTDYRF